MAIWKSEDAKSLERDLDPEIRRQILADVHLRWWTNAALLIAIIVGICTAMLHGGNMSASVTAFGASLGLGGVLGFLFGVPGARSPVNVVKAGSVAFSTGSQSSPQGGAVVERVNAGNPHEGSAQITGAPEDASKKLPEEKVEKAREPSSSQPQATGAKDSGPPPPTSTEHQSSNLEQVADWVTKLLLGGGLTQMQRIPPTVWKWAGLVAVGIAGSPKGLDDHQAFAAGLLIYAFVLGFFGGFLTTKLQLGKSIW